MRKKWFVLAPLGMVLFIAIGGVVVQHLWNWLLPALFAWRQITFWQGLGLLVLCRILFGRLGGAGRGFDRSHFRQRWSRRWEHMTPEEREKFRQKWGSRCAGFETHGTAVSGSDKPA